MEDWTYVVELLSSYDDKCKEVEDLAQNQIFSLDVPVFNKLRDILPFNLLAALRRMEYWFGEVPTVEHALCLVILTDYLSCAYNQRHFYRTFENALKNKFIDSLFLKLYDEWFKVFCGRHIIHFTNSEFESVKKSLSRSVDRFPESFRHKFRLRSIVQLCTKYGENLLKTNLQNVNNNLTKHQILQVPSKRLLWEDNCKENLVDTCLKNRNKADITKYVVKKQVQEVKTNNVFVPNAKKSISSPVVRCTDKNIRVSPEKLFGKRMSDEHSADSADLLEHWLMLTETFKESTIKDHSHEMLSSSDDCLFSEESSIDSQAASSSENKIATSGDTILNTSLSDTVLNCSPADDIFGNENKLVEPKLEAGDNEKTNTCVYVPETDKEKMNIVNNNCAKSNEEPGVNEVICICDCCDVNTKHTIGKEKVSTVSVPKKQLNAFDILMRKVIPSKRKRFL